MKVWPGRPYQRSAEVELVGVDETVDQYDLSGAVQNGVREASYRIEHVTLHSYGGSILTPAGVLLVFSGAPSIASGDTAISEAEGLQVLASIAVAAADWQSLTNGTGTMAVVTKSPGFAVAEGDVIYYAWYHTDATAINSAGGDDEVLSVTTTYLPYA